MIKEHFSFIGEDTKLGNRPPIEKALEEIGEKAANRISCGINKNNYRNIAVIEKSLGGFPKYLGITDSSFKKICEAFNSKMGIIYEDLKDEWMYNEELLKKAKFIKRSSAALERKYPYEYAHWSGYELRNGQFLFIAGNATCYDVDEKDFYNVTGLSQKDILAMYDALRIYYNAKKTSTSTDSLRATLKDAEEKVDKVQRKSFDWYNAVASRLMCTRSNGRSINPYTDTCAEYFDTIITKSDFSLIPYGSFLLTGDKGILSSEIELSPMCIASKERLDPSFNFDITNWVAFIVDKSLFGGTKFIRTGGKNAGKTY